MKEVLILIPEGVDTRDIFYMRRETLGDIRFVKPLVARCRSDISKEEYDNHVKSMSLAPTAPPSREEFETLCSRIEKLERESERQCARVIKMEEGISDDLK